LVTDIYGFEVCHNSIAEKNQDFPTRLAKENILRNAGNGTRAVDCKLSRK
jgi:hypothetical protein